MILKKRFGLFCFLVFMISLILPFVSSSFSTSVSVNLTGPPGLTIIDPQNITYNYATNIPLNFISGGDNFWYNLDSGVNISITGNTFFSTSQGSHTLYLYANNSDGITGKNVTFNVVLSSGAGGGGGGGGGGGAREQAPIQKQFSNADFKITPSEIKLKMKQGESVRKELVFENTGGSSLVIHLENPLKDYLTISDSDFNLNIGESKTIYLDFVVGNSVPADIYFGNLEATSGELSKSVLISLEVETKNPPLRVDLELPKKFLVVHPGKKVSTNIDIILLNGIKNLDVDVDYKIANLKGDSFSLDSENFFIVDKISYSKDFEIPSDFKLGKAVFYVRANSGEESASSSVWFFVVKRSFLEISLIVLIILILIILFIKRKILLSKLKNFK